MGERRLLDVAALAVRLVENHPGHPYLAEALADGLAGEDTLLVHGYVPLRAQWVLVSEWGIDRVDARNAVGTFLQQPHETVDADTDVLLDAYESSAAKNHDVYDCFLLALAREHEADAIVTTDTDFETLCANEAVAYHNPVPEDVLGRFHAFEASPG